MKTKVKTEKDFDSVKTFRAIKEKISKDIKDMAFAQLSVYLDIEKSNPITKEIK